MSEDRVIQLVAQQAAAELARRMAGIVDERVYPAEEAAELIGLRGPRAGKTIREIPKGVLPRKPLTPGGKMVGFLGRDLRAYNERDTRKAG